LLTGIGSIQHDAGTVTTNYFVVDEKTTSNQIEGQFKLMVERKDIFLLLINSQIANCIRESLEKVNQANEQNSTFLPVIVELPSANALSK